MSLGCVGWCWDDFGMFFERFLDTFVIIPRFDSPFRFLLSPFARLGRVARLWASGLAFGARPGCGEYIAKGRRITDKAKAYNAPNGELVKKSIIRLRCGRYTPALRARWSPFLAHFPYTLTFTIALSNAPGVKTPPHTTPHQPHTNPIPGGGGGCPPPTCSSRVGIYFPRWPSPELRTQRSAARPDQRRCSSEAQVMVTLPNASYLTPWHQRPIPPQPDPNPTQPDLS